jgi:hypothetical protein
MPIRPEMRDVYPPDWDARSLAVKEAAGWRCQCTGFCGRPSNHIDPEGRCVNRHGRPAFASGSTVVLTTAHLDHDPENWDDPRLAALCQGCHLWYDREHHAETRALRRHEQLVAAGQLSLALELVRGST